MHFLLVLHDVPVSSAIGARWRSMPLAPRPAILAPPCTRPRWHFFTPSCSPPPPNLRARNPAPDLAACPRTAIGTKPHVQWRTCTCIPTRTGRPTRGAVPAPLPLPTHTAPTPGCVWIVQRGEHWLWWSGQPAGSGWGPSTLTPACRPYVPRGGAAGLTASRAAAPGSGTCMPACSARMRVEPRAALSPYRWRGPAVAQELQQL